MRKVTIYPDNKKMAKKALKKQVLALYGMALNNMLNIYSIEKPDLKWSIGV